MTSLALPARRLRMRLSASIVLPTLGTAMVLAFVLNLAFGPVPIAPGRVAGILLESLGLPIDAGASGQEHAIIAAIRLPRACLAMLVGASLAVSGALLQGLFRNPLADPTLVGVSSGAALAAIAMIVMGGVVLTGALKPLAAYAIPAAAFLGGLTATMLIYRIGVHRGQTLVSTMLLAGIAINAVAGALSGMLVFGSNDLQLRDITFWTLGSLGGATPKTVMIATPPILLFLFAAPRLARALNAYMLGEREARHLGFEVEPMKRFCVLGVAVAVGVSVAMSGLIGFVGLIVPHLVRLTAGSDHRIVLPGSALLGATLMLVADLFARMAVAPAELPIGIVTSTIGGPFFLWLLLRRRSAEIEA